MKYTHVVLDRQEVYNALTDVFKMGDLADDVLSNHDTSDEAREKLKQIVKLCDWALKSVHDSGKEGKELVEAINEAAYCRRHDI